MLILVIFYGMAVKSFHRLLSPGRWAENWAEISSKKFSPSGHMPVGMCAVQNARPRGGFSSSRDRADAVCEALHARGLVWRIRLPTGSTEKKQTEFENRPKIKRPRIDRRFPEIDRCNWVEVQDRADHPSKTRFGRKSKAEVKRLLPVLKTSQCLSLTLAFSRQTDGRQCPVMLRLTPRLLSRRLNALHDLKGLFLDRLFEGATNFADDCRSNDGFDLSEKMWQHWQSRHPRLEPED